MRLKLGLSVSIHQNFEKPDVVLGPSVGPRHDGTASPVLLQPDLQPGILKPVAADSTGKRGKALSRRIGQNGSIEIRNGMYRGRYLIDVAGEEKRVNKAVVLGPVSEMTKSEARRKLKSIIAAEGINSPDYVIPSSELFEKRVIRWQQDYASRQKPSSQTLWHSHTNRYLLPKWGKYPVDGIKEEMVNEWLAELAHLAPETQRGIIKNLQMILGKKFGKGKIHYPSKREARRQHPCHTPEQMQMIVDAETGLYKTLFSTAAETGMRAGELYGLRVEDVDFKRLLIFVRRSVWGGKEQSTKSKNADRVIDIQPQLAETILRHLQGRTEGWIFRSRTGTPLCHSHVIRRLHLLLKKLGIPRSGMHAFRHGRVSYLVECDTPIDTIRAWIGHGSDRMVRLYTHLRPGYRKRILSQVPSLLHPVHPQLEVVKTEQVA